MEYIIVIIAVAIAIVDAMAKKKKKEGDAAIARAIAAKSAREQPKSKLPTPVEQVSEKKREQMARTEQWRAAKVQQDDAERLHSIHVDTCESKLESLRVLYDAGILDREEYAQRVARIKSKHGQA
ncbi:MAG: hypothetical protein E7425_11110 [Ruminococcaceae bacterium]|jgi:hypothetical protein|nr:hypothetical protein [Oscillospiraceae bacterium]